MKFACLGCKAEYSQLAEWVAHVRTGHVAVAVEDVVVTMRMNAGIAPPAIPVRAIVAGSPVSWRVAAVQEVGIARGGAQVSLRELVASAVPEYTVLSLEEARAHLPQCGAGGGHRLERSGYCTVCRTVWLALDDTRRLGADVVIDTLRRSLAAPMREEG